MTEPSTGVTEPDNGFITRMAEQLPSAQTMLIIVLCIVIMAVLLVGIHLLRTLNRMQKLLREYQEKGSAEFRTMKETRESKLESSLQRVLNRASQKEETAKAERDEVSALLSDLSHQLKTPMANVRMYTELLEDESLQAEERIRFARQAKGQTEKMQWLLENMLRASQLEQGMITFAAEYTGIRETIGKAVSGIYAQASDKEITIEIEPFDDKKVYHNPKWTAEAIGNILDNAVKYSPQGGTITVRIQPLEIYTQIEISDQGFGIDEDEYNEIFKRFYRGRKTRQMEGNGLGLYLAQLILNKEKGYITVASQKGEGSSFRIFLLNEVLTIL